MRAPAPTGRAPRRRTGTAARPLALALAVAAAALGLALLSAPGSAARDSDAPPGSSPRWLPCERWVQSHWIPYDEDRLYRLLGADRERVLDWLRDDQRRTLGGLVARLGKDPDRLVRGLVSPWRGRVSAAHYAELKRRAGKTLTQGHLAQHLFFHPFHQPAVAMDAKRIFGVAPLEYQRRRLLGHSPARIGRANGRTRAEVRAGALRVLRAAARSGVRSRSTSRAQARRFLAWQERGIEHWLDSRIRKPGYTGAVPRRPLTGEALRCRLFRGNSEKPGIRPAGAASATATGALCRIAHG